MLPSLVFWSVKFFCVKLWWDLVNFHQIYHYHNFCHVNIIYRTFFITTKFHFSINHIYGAQLLTYDVLQFYFLFTLIFYFLCVFRYFLVFLVFVLVYFLSFFIFIDFIFLIILLTFFIVFFLSSIIFSVFFVFWKKKTNENHVAERLK